MIVYLLHYPNGNQLGHYLGVAESEVAIDTEAIPHGRGTRHVYEDDEPPVIADVWEADDAHALHAKLSKQGSRRRLCSICNPGNARGAGRGNWERQAPELQGGE